MITIEKWPVPSNINSPYGLGPKGSSLVSPPSAVTEQRPGSYQSVFGTLGAFSQVVKGPVFAFGFDGFFGPWGCGLGKSFLFFFPQKT